MTKGLSLSNSETTLVDEWFQITKLTDFLFAISEPRHYEHTVVYLIIGKDQAILIDTGCGIGDLRSVVEHLTHFPVTVVNTHTHLDHLGSNRQFSDIMIFDHPCSHKLSTKGASREDVVWELLNEAVVSLPSGFIYEEVSIPPFPVLRWLQNGDILDIGDVRLKVLHTPGEAVDHICLLDETHRILFSGDILLDGAVWSHLEGGNIHELSASYERLMRYYNEFDVIMPSHNAPCQGKDLLPFALAASREVISGKIEPTLGTDPWGRPFKKYDFERISILLK